MRLSSCGDKHLINTIKGGSVTKVRSMNSLGKPAPVFKKVRGVYEGLRSCTNRLNSAPEVSNINAKIENPVANRRLHEVKAPKNGALPFGKDGGKDSSFRDMTLRELKNRCKAKKRKRVKVQSFKPLQDQIKVEPAEVDPDLDEPLISLKVKVPKAKKKRRVSSTPAVLLRCESQDLMPARQLQVQADLLLPVRVKAEVMDSDSEECQNVICAGYFDTANKKGESWDAEGTSSFLVDNQSMESNLHDKDYQSCSLNEMPCDPPENVEPLAVLIPSCDEIMDLENQENPCRQFVLLPTLEYGEELQLTSPIEDESSDSNGHSLSCDLVEFSGHGESNSAAVIPWNIAYDSSEDETDHGGVSSEHQENVSCEEIMDVEDQEKPCQQLVLLPTLEYGKELQLTFPFEDKSASSTGCSLLQRCSNTHEKSNLSELDRSEGRQPLECTNIDRLNNNLSGNETQPDEVDDGLFTCEERLPQPPANVDAGRDSISYSQKFPVGKTPSSSVAFQVPERLLSTRKVVSPTSEERLSMSMNSAGSCGDADFLDCNEVLCNEEKTEVQSLFEESKMHKNVSKSPQEPPAIKKIKFIIGPSQNRKKTKTGRSSPPKGSMEGPRNTRSLPKVTSGCTSVQGCSQNSVAFSQRQMQDIESLATKLMSELKSMKDIVEEKLLFGAYRSVSSKHDADEVKNAITNATKTEEMAKKWLSIMGRDCNRFCKIMSQNINLPVDVTETLPREKRKVAFADEAGGSLCHVKYFKNGTTSPE